jgi:hypothetical protein
MDVYGNFIHNHPKLEITQIRMNKPSVVHSDNRTQLRIQKSFNSCNNIDSLQRHFSDLKGSTSIYVTFCKRWNNGTANRLVVDRGKGLGGSDDTRATQWDVRLTELPQTEHGAL